MSNSMKKILKKIHKIFNISLFHWPWYVSINLEQRVKKYNKNKK